MEAIELIELIARGEDSRHQFKRDESNADSIAAELAAFTNSGGGLLLLGVNDDGSVVAVDRHVAHEGRIDLPLLRRRGAAPRWPEDCRQCCRCPGHITRPLHSR